MLVHEAMSTGKDHQIYEDQRQRHDRPAAGRHVLVLDWNEHSEPKGTGTDDSSLDTERRVTKVILVVPAIEDRLRIAVLAEISMNWFLYSFSLLEVIAPPALGVLLFRKMRNDPMSLRGRTRLHAGMLGAGTGHRLGHPESDASRVPHGN